ncbi:MAG: response regulator [Leptospiraceae bacterium]|nr:response regulator [Leptospiraceae bacterium]
MADTVLILEDAVFVREMEKKILFEKDKQVVGESNSSAEGVQLYQKLRPQLVIVDLQLADGTGLEAMQAISKIDDRARFLVISSHTALLDGIEAELESRIVGRMRKPFTVDELRTVLDQL